MKSIFWYLTVLFACVGSPLRATPVVPVNNTAVPTIQDQWAKSINMCLQDIVNIPSTIPALPWHTLAWQVLNYRTGPYAFNWRNPYIYCHVFKDGYEPLQDLPINDNDKKHMHYSRNYFFMKTKYNEFKSVLSYAVAFTQRSWNNESVAFITTLLQQKKKILDAFIKQLEDVQNQLATPNDAAIKNDAYMASCMDFLKESPKINDALSSNQSYKVQEHASNREVDGPIQANLTTIQSLAYPVLSKSLKQDVLGEGINNLKRNIIHVVLFLKEIMRYELLAAGTEKLIALQNTGTKILDFTPEIIQYLKTHLSCSGHYDEQS